MKNKKEHRFTYVSLPISAIQLDLSKNKDLLKLQNRCHIVKTTLNFDQYGNLWSINTQQLRRTSCPRPWTSSLLSTAGLGSF